MILLTEHNSGNFQNCSKQLEHFYITDAALHRYFFVESFCPVLIFLKHLSQCIPVGPNSKHQMCSSSGKACSLVGIGAPMYHASWEGVGRKAAQPTASMRTCAPAFVRALPTYSRHLLIRSCAIRFPGKYEFLLSPDGCPVEVMHIFIG